MRKMKRFLAGLLVAAMSMGMAMPAAAATETEDKEVEKTWIDMQSVVIKKQYELASDSNANAVSPEEEFEFTISRGAKLDGDTMVYVKNQAEGIKNDATIPLPTIQNGGKVKFVEGAAGNAAKKLQPIVVDLRKEDGSSIYSGVGIYYYTIQEKIGDNMGVTYHAEPIVLVVSVIQQGDGKVRVGAVHTERPIDENNKEGKKCDTITNLYEAHDLTIKKEVTGTFGDKDNKYFDVTVTFEKDADMNVGSAILYSGGSGDYVKTDAVAVATNADWTDNKETIPLRLKHNDTFTFTNIPEGITYTVQEADYVTTDGYNMPSFTIISGSKNEEKTNTYSIEKTITGSDDKVVITNNKDGIVDAGVLLDSAPYVLLLAVAGFGLFAVVGRKRREDI